MSYGLQIAASGLLTTLYRQDVLANNLANMDTPGFKIDIPTTRPRDAVRREDGLPFMPSNDLLDRLGGGAILNPNRISFAQGGLRDTTNPLDLGITGQGFFVVRQGGGELALTRDGRMTRNAEGQLVLSSSGALVMDASNNPIEVPPGPAPSVAADGTLSQFGAPVARLRIVEVADLDRLGKIGSSLFSVPADVLSSASPFTGTVRQGVYEESGADEINTIMQLTSAARDVEGQVSMIQQHDRLLDRAINSLGRVT